MTDRLAEQGAVLYGLDNPTSAGVSRLGAAGALQAAIADAIDNGRASATASRIGGLGRIYALAASNAISSAITYILPMYGQSLSLGITPSTLADLQSVESGKTITGATQANPVVISSAAHGFADGDEVFISGVSGMTNINGRSYTVASAAADSFALKHHDGVDVDGTAFAAYTSGGIAERTLVSATHKMLNGGVRPHYDHRLLASGNVNNHIGRTQISSLVPLRERASPIDNTCGETFAYGMGKVLSTPSVMFAAGRAAYTAQMLSFEDSSGFFHFSNLYACVKEAYNLIEADGRTPTLAPMIYKQGEADTATTKADWKTKVQLIRSDAQRTWRHATKSAQTVQMVLDQLGYSIAAYAELAVGAIEMHRDVANIYCAGPTYWCAYLANNDVHFTQAMYRNYGEHLGRVVQSIISTGDWNPCHITGVSRAGTSISVTVHVPEGALSKDTTLVSAATNDGFTYSGANITNVAITDDGASDHTAVITITIDADAGGTLGYAYNNGTASRVGPELGMRGNFRDSSTLVSTFDASPLYNWLCNDQWVIA